MGGNKKITPLKKFFWSNLRREERFLSSKGKRRKRETLLDIYYYCNELIFKSFYIIKIKFKNIGMYPIICL
jgi:hypothetical protein